MVGIEVNEMTIIFYFRKITLIVFLLILGKGDINRSVFYKKSRKHKKAEYFFFYLLFV